MSYGKVISLNDEVVEIPKMRKDQQRKIQNLVRANGEFPIVALGLVRDYAKGIEHVRSIQHDEVDGVIKVILKSDYSKLITEYTFRLQAPILLETPTL
jgi:hypothetical protein